MEFQVIHQDFSCKARSCRIATPHGSVETPVFMPVGTQATVKGLSPEELESLGAWMILGNTYHLYLRPGAERIERLGGLHRFMHWNRSILTDSGGFQVFSLAKRRKISEEGVVFQSHIDGSRHCIRPEDAVRIQMQLGSDIIMCFDECTAYPVLREYAEESVKRTIRWAERCRKARTRSSQALFGIVQGSVCLDLREFCMEKLAEMGFDGYALGSLSVGEPKEKMMEVLEFMVPRMPSHKPRYLMGVGTPEDLVEGVRLGVDMFDCVMPTRNARNGMLFTSTGDIHIRNRCHADDGRPIEEGCSCYTCVRFSRAYLRHLFMARELLAYRLNSLHNLHYYIKLMSDMRDAVRSDTFEDFRKTFHARRKSEEESGKKALS